MSGGGNDGLRGDSGRGLRGDSGGLRGDSGGGSGRLRVSVVAVVVS